ncbi:MAG: hypothetical protein Tsb002_06550 [Wenzhouxiangellaceae bacterium]
MNLKTLRDHAGTIEPQQLKKQELHLTDDLERKIIALYALGNSYQQIRGHIQEIYNIELSNVIPNSIINIDIDEDIGSHSSGTDGQQ